MTASRVKQEVKWIEYVTVQRVFTLGHDGVTIGRHGPFTRDGPEEIALDGVRSGSRQSDIIMGGELTASDFSSLRRHVGKSIYSFVIFIHKERTIRGITWRNPSTILSVFSRVFTL